MSPLQTVIWWAGWVVTALGGAGGLVELVKSVLEWRKITNDARKAPVDLDVLSTTTTELVLRTQITVLETRTAAAETRAAAAETRAAAAEMRLSRLGKM
jgi:hypothetical protein